MRSIDSVSAPLNVYAPIYGVVDEPNLDGAPATENEITHAGILAQDQMKFFERLSVRLGLRRDKVRNVVVDSETNEDWATSANVGVVYEVMPGAGARTSAILSLLTPLQGPMRQGLASNRRRASRSRQG